MIRLRSNCSSDVFPAQLAEATSRARTIQSVDAFACEDELDVLQATLNEGEIGCGTKIVLGGHGHDPHRGN